MVAVILATVLLLLAFIVLAEYSTSALFVTSASLSDKSCPVDLLLFHVTDVNWTACSYLCWRRDECLSVVHQQDNQTCVGCSGSFPVLSDSHETGHRQEVLLKVEPYIAVGGMKLRIVTEDILRYDATGDACSEQGALVKLDTPYKMLALGSYLMNTYNDGGFHAFWVQCRYNVTADTWSYDDGTPLVDGFFWVPFDRFYMLLLGKNCCLLYSKIAYMYAPMPMFCDLEESYICEYN